MHIFEICGKILGPSRRHNVQTKPKSSIAFWSKSNIISQKHAVYFK
jgi:hypothetical protein